MVNINDRQGFYQDKYWIKFALEVLQKLDTPIKAIAANMEIPIDTLYPMFRGERSFHAQLLPKLLKAVEPKDQTLICKWMLQPIEKKAVDFDAVEIVKGETPKYKITHTIPLKSVIIIEKDGTVESTTFNIIKDEAKP